MKLYKNNSRAFTLLDILLVAAIVSLLSSLFLFQVTEAKKKADDAHMQVEAQQISTAIEIYKDSKEQVPHSLTVTSPSGTYLESDPNYTAHLQSLVDEGYIPQIPRSPNGTSYTYAFTPDFKTAAFVIRTNKSGNICRGISGSDSENSALCNSVLNSDEEETTYPGMQTITTTGGSQILASGEEKIFKFYSETASSIFSGLPQESDPLCGMAIPGGIYDCTPTPDFAVSFSNGGLDIGNGYYSGMVSCDITSLGEGETTSCSKNEGEYVIKNLDADLRIMSITWTSNE